MLCYAAGVLTVYIPTEINSQVCARAFSENTLIPKWYSFDVKMFNTIRHYENGSYFDYPYGKEWEDYLASINATKRPAAP